MIALGRPGHRRTWSRSSRCSSRRPPPRPCAASRADRRAHGRAARPGRKRSPLTAWREPRTLLIGVFVLAFAFAEGTGNDWIGVAIDRRLHVVAGASARSRSRCSSRAMTLGRWFGPALLDRYGRVRVRARHRRVAVLGLLFVVFGGSLGRRDGRRARCGAWASRSASRSAMSAAADDAAHAAGPRQRRLLDRLLAFLAGPPLVGFLGHEVGLRALTAAAALVTLGLLLSGVLRPPELEQDVDATVALRAGA